MATARVTQAVVEVCIVQAPAARVTQAVIEICVAVSSNPTPTPGQGISPGGTPLGVQRCPRKNTPYDRCLEEEGRLMRRITFPPPCSIPEEYRDLLPWDDTFGAIPPEAKPFLRQGGIVTPTTVSGDNSVISFRVPTGWDGLLSGFYFNYSGAGFTQGSGDIIWRIQCNQYFLKDLSNTPYLLGDPVNPVPMTEGKVLFSGQLVRAIVNVPNLSGMIQIGNSTVYAGLLGFFWPR